MQTISVQQLQEKMKTSESEKVIAIDVRTNSEHREQHIPGTRNMPLSTIKNNISYLKKLETVYVYCRSGDRSAKACKQLEQMGVHAINVIGGILEWEKAGYATVKDKHVISVIRQVMITAGGLVLLGSVLAWLVSPGWIWLSALVGAGLIFSGISGFCGMALVLEKMPWNRVSKERTHSLEKDDYSIRQFEDKGLAHYSYALVSKGKIALIDPARNPEPYYAFAKEVGGDIEAVIETHPHADFVSSHKEIAATTGATIYVSKLIGADYEHKDFDEGDEISLGAITLSALNTPGHSPDSICILVHNTAGIAEVLFSGDTLFVGDVGRPDLRENIGNITALREELAGMMYDTVQKKLKPLDDSILVYPAHGSGTLCGKNLRSAPFTTIGQERSTNPAFAKMSREEFISRLTSGQPFIPKYFAYDVDQNKSGGKEYHSSLEHVPVVTEVPSGVLVIDTRNKEAFQSGHIPGAINIPDGDKFETWLGTVVSPRESFYLVVTDDDAKHTILEKAAKIGYESLIKGVFIGNVGTTQLPSFNEPDFKEHCDNYTIVDLRNPSEVSHRKPFKDSIEIPLYELSERVDELPCDKPIVVHCAGGYRSAIGASIIAPHRTVYDLGSSVLSYFS